MTEIPPDPYVGRLIASRKSPAVLKLQLAKLRSRLPDCIVFAFEGDHDKSAYFQWTRRAREELIYEPFPCGGKSQVFAFRDMLERDLTGLAKRVYFFIDRDFDDHRGRPPHAQTTFMTDRYSVENYLVDDAVLEEVLKDEFHCHAAPEVRERVRQEFRACYQQFLVTTKHLNFRLFLARRLNIQPSKQVPDAAKYFATITLSQVTKAAIPVEEVVVLPEESSTEQVEALAPEFESLDPVLRYRGKFSFAFLMKWLELLCDERRTSVDTLFAGMEKTRSVSCQTLSIGMLASKSPMPRGLADFINRVN